MKTKTRSTSRRRDEDRKAGPSKKAGVSMSVGASGKKNGLVSSLVTSVMNVGLESFHASLIAQKARVVHLEWRPPAGGDPKKIETLRKIRSFAVR